MFGLISMKSHREELKRQSDNLWSHFNMWLENFHRCQNDLDIEKRKVELLKAKLTYTENKIVNPEVEPCILGDELSVAYVMGKITLEGAVPVHKTVTLSVKL